MATYHTADTERLEHCCCCSCWWHDDWELMRQRKHSEKVVAELECILAADELVVAGAAVVAVACYQR